MRKVFCLFISLILFAQTVSAQSFIRDEEIEANIKFIIDPIIVAAGLKPKDIKLHIIDDKEINAYVTQGRNLFITTGLLRQFENPNVLAGVVAHEIGHLKAEHVVIKKGEIEDANKAMIMGAVLGLATALAGRADVATGILLGSSTYEYKKFLKYSRQHETEADNYAIDFLRKTGHNADGLLEMFKEISRQEKTLKRDPYNSTHPLSSSRVANIKKLSKILSKHDGFNSKFKKAYRRGIIKLRAFIDPTVRTLKTYHGNDYESRLARSVVYYREGKINKSLAALDGLLKEHPNDPYLNELKGQVLYENGFANKSLSYYKKARMLLPDSILIQFEFAVAMISASHKSNNTRKLLLESAKILSSLLRREPNNITFLHYLSIAYGKAGQITKANLALAEKSILLDKKQDAIRFANSVLESTKQNSTEYIKAQDILLSYK